MGHLVEASLVVTVVEGKGDVLQSTRNRINARSLLSMNPSDVVPSAFRPDRTDIALRCSSALVVRQERGNDRDHPPEERLDVRLLFWGCGP